MRRAIIETETVDEYSLPDMTPEKIGTVFTGVQKYLEGEENQGTYHETFHPPALKLWRTNFVTYK